MHISVFLNGTEKKVSTAVKTIETDAAVVRPEAVYNDVNSVSHFCYENISQSISTDTLACFSCQVVSALLSDNVLTFCFLGFQLALTAQPC